MRTTELLQHCDEYYGRILRRVDAKLTDPVHQRVAKRVICSWITGGSDTIRTVMDGVDLSLDHPHLWDIYALEDRDQLWEMLEGLQYAYNDPSVAHMRPVFDASGLADMFDCIVECMRVLYDETSFIKYNCRLDAYVGGAQLVPYKVAVLKNRIRAIANLPPVTEIVSDLMDPFICTPVIAMQTFRKWRTNMLWRRLREYVRCLHRTIPDRVTETRDVMVHVVGALGL